MDGAAGNETISEDATIAQEVAQDAGFLQEEAAPAEGEEAQPAEGEAAA